MYTTDASDTPAWPDGLAACLVRLRGNVIAMWSARVLALGAAHPNVDAPLLAPVAPALLDELAQQLTHAQSGTAGAPPQRSGPLTAGMHALADLVCELQLLRATILDALQTGGRVLSARDVELICASFDGWLLAAAQAPPGLPLHVSDACIDGFAHDLRNPLGVASASAQLIGLKSSDPTITSLAGRIVKKIGDADALIQTLQDTAALADGKSPVLNLSAFEIMALIEEVCVDLPLLGQPVSVVGERIEGYWCMVTMKRSLENLVTRARKHGRRAAPITVRVKQHNERMQLSVNNAGPAIAPHDLARLFEPPRRQEEIAVKGWSLGLPYVRSVAERHGGSLIVDSDEARGTTLTLDVPIDARAYVAA